MGLSKWLRAHDYDYAPSGRLRRVERVRHLPYKWDPYLAEWVPIMSAKADADHRKGHGRARGRERKRLDTGGDE